MKLVYKVIIPIVIVFILFFSILLNYITNSQEDIVSKFKSSVNTLAIEQFDKRKTEKLSTENDYLDFTAFLASQIAVEYVYNYETVNIEAPLSKFLSMNSIEGILVYDTIGKENFITLIKDESGNPIRVKTLPGSFASYKQFKKIMSKTALGEREEDYGYVIIYYNEALVKQVIEEKQKVVMGNLEHIKNEIKEDMDSMMKNQTMFILAICIVLALFIFYMVQKIVLNPLGKLKIGLDEFFLFLQNKKDSTSQIQLNLNDEFGQMANSLNENIAVSSRLHEEIFELNTNLENRVEEKTKEVKTLLNNTGQGFLSFDKNFVIDAEYSKECSKLFVQDIKGKNIVDLLFFENEEKLFFKDVILDTLNAKDVVIRKSLLSLLPSNIILNKRALKLEYKVLEDDKFMLILTNITSEIKLEKKIKKEQQILKMIVAVVSDSDIFYDIKKDYLHFMSTYKTIIDTTKTPLFNLSEVFRTLHTIKGVFAQLYMTNTIDFLHYLETQISQMIKGNSDTNGDLLALLEESDFKAVLQQDLNIIKDILGEDFLDSENIIKIDLNDIQSLQKKISYILEQKEHISSECKEIFCQVQNLTSQKLINLLKPYIKLSQQLSNRLNKEIYKFEVIGDKDVVAPEEFKPFIKSLGHIFRNSIDHGIEDPETRVLNNKDKTGTILCNFEKENDYLQIIISDDGAGIDCEKIKQKLSLRDINTDGLSNNEIYKFIFEDNFSTKDNITLVSGRGIGMSAVKAELEKINAQVEIQSKPNIGTTFVFRLPLVHDLANNSNKSNNEHNLDNSFLDPIINRSITFLNTDLGIEWLKEDIDVSTPPKAVLNKHTAIIKTIGSIEGIITIGYEESLLEKIAELFYLKENWDDEYEDELAKNISSEVMNIIVGNALVNTFDESAITFLPPYVLEEEKTLEKRQNSTMTLAIIKTQFGNMFVHLLGPKKLFEDEFKGL